MVSYSYTITEEDLNALVEVIALRPDNVKRMRLLQIIYMVLAAILISLAIPNNMYMLVFAALILAAMFGVKPLFTYRLKKSLAIDRSSVLSDNRKYEFSDDGMLMVSETGAHEEKWESFADFQSYGNHLFMKRKSGGFVIVNKDALSSEQLQELMGLINAHVEKR